MPVRTPNRLAGEKSPYLLQHAYNPVDWYPWCDEAFERARREDRPVFLSIGYSTCHWCHVMERESFEDGEVAELLNRWFVCIKVDREERPDIDSVYMRAAVLINGTGGWPLTVFMTPDREPFLVATYIPKTSSPGRVGLLELLPAVARAWADDRQRVQRVAREVVSALGRRRTGGGPALGPGVLDKAFADLSDRYDEHNGGFGTAPKFPSPHQLVFLLHYWARTGEGRALEMVRTTLTAMRRGGLFDHLGYGFHRYCTDAEWRVPHFEKMLYDQALLVLAYSEAYSACGDAYFAGVVRETADYVLGILLDDGGGFCSAEDADSEGEEGRFYLWTAEEIRRALDNRDDYRVFAHHFQVREEGNFVREATGSLTGQNILYAPRTVESTARDLGLSTDEVQAALERARGRLLEIRGHRVRPHLDDKVLTDWNGLMIAALARAYRAVGDSRLLVAARGAADFILRTMIAGDGRLYHRYRDGEVAVPGLLDDYAFLIWGLLELYQSTFEEQYLEQAHQLSGEMLTLFRDPDGGGLLLTGRDAEPLIAATKHAYDGATPSGNSIAALDLAMLDLLLADPTLRGAAIETVRAFAGDILRSPSAFTMMLVAHGFIIGPTALVVVEGRPEWPGTRSMVSAVREDYRPGVLVQVVPPHGQSTPGLQSGAAPRSWQTGLLPRAHVCRGGMCSAPTSSVSRLLELLDSSVP